MCQYGLVEIIELLINDHRVDINIKDYDNETSFSLACEFGHFTIIKKFFKNYQLQINTLNYKLITSFNTICDQNLFEIIKDPHVEINTCDCNGWTPFHNACGKGNLNIIYLFLSSNRMMNLQKKN